MSSLIVAIDRKLFNALKRLKRKNVKLLIFITATLNLILFVLYLHHYEHSSLQDNIVVNSLYSLFSIMQDADEDVITSAAILYHKLNFNTEAKWINRYYLHENLLTVPYGNRKNERLESINDLEFYDSDPRLSWSVYLNYLINNEENFEEMPFSWYDWMDFDMYNKLLSVRHSNENNFTCEFAFKPSFDFDTLKSIESALQERLFEFEHEKYDDRNTYQQISKVRNNVDIEKSCQTVPGGPFQLPFNVTTLVDSVRPEMYFINAKNYLLHNFNNPISITILEGGKNSYRVNIDQHDNSNMIQSGLLKQFVEEQTSKQSNRNKNIEFDHISFYENFLKTDIASKLRIEIPYCNKDIFNKNLVDLSIDDFAFDVAERIKGLRHDLQTFNNLTRHDLNYLSSLENSININPALAPKYFNEARNILQFKSLGHHRDKRFFNGPTTEGSVEYADRLNSLIRTFQKFTISNGIVSWLSHGTLYSHLYDGLAFPWDNDFDLQMPISHLHYMAQYFNQSIILEDPREGNGRFLLDVGSSISVRTKGNGLNNIDARFIDIDSGIYIDITGLSFSSEPIPLNKRVSLLTADAMEAALVDETVKNPGDDIKNPELGAELAALTISELKIYVDEHPNEFATDQKKKIADMAKIEGKLPITSPSKGLTQLQRYLLNKRLQMVNCRNGHFSRFDMISPLSNSYYHGVPALIPNKVVTSLLKEYNLPANFDFLVYEGRAFEPKMKFWISVSNLRSAMNTAKDQNLEYIESTPDTLSFNDLLRAIKNLIKIGSHDYLSAFFNSLSMTNYRLKELEIMYDDSITADEKQIALQYLRTTVGPTISSPGKDPIIYTQEKNLWKSYEAKLSEEEKADIILYVEVNALNNFWEKFSDLYNNRLYDASGEVNLNEVGLDLFHNYKEQGMNIFAKDPNIN
ncbi:hypothetical protein KAFR_0D03640 [Kazachstania africana CBS 2517]|uniref:LicD/FKTN/FKRP nucleotidyltransferase domain-containing protein n=1 Tax=Kazachstania africana (strain ATCC 22294 / BCRC 22015 / CBS 2517 / CECT 1963 / NBRC 1671 / NRRL Y-8276) TaxID=1071382 RepID=H2AUG2_KAZAF|nr:hypothetical protein KAFR_0D03640 [Kazachstania africana CBS 2517]CCF58012.1 hypothetical protein KAFR_0D03640 [Kazachstania africana CBS 2517]